MTTEPTDAQIQAVRDEFFYAEHHRGDYDLAMAAEIVWLRDTVEALRAEVVLLDSALEQQLEETDAVEVELAVLKEALERMRFS